MFNSTILRSSFRHLYLSTVGLFRHPSPGIHILNSHFVQQGMINENFKNIYFDFIDYLAKKTTIINFDVATKKLIDKDIPSDSCLVALSYDDGFEECATVITPVLDQFNIKAAFFINSNYINGNNKYIDVFNQTVGVVEKKPMTWDQIKSLHNNGHVVGSHLFDHLNIADLENSELRNQLIKNKIELESKLDYKCEYFAWPFGQSKHFNFPALKIVEDYHKYVFSGTDYKRYFSMDNSVINRRHVESFWPKSHVNYFISAKKTL